MKLLAFRSTVNVCAVPSVPFEAERDDLRGMVSSVTVLLTEVFDIVVPEILPFAEIATDFVPSELCVTVAECVAA